MPPRTPKPAKPPTKKSPKQPTQLSPETPAAPPRAPALGSVADLTADLLDRLRRGGLTDVHTRVAIGKLLAQVQSLLGHGAWLSWLDAEVPFEPRSAQNYIGLANWAEARPELFDQIAPLGARKLYRLMRVDDPHLAALFLEDAQQKISTSSRSLRLTNQIRGTANGTSQVASWSSTSKAAVTLRFHARR
jgi:hypothetical protein